MKTCCRCKQAKEPSKFGRKRGSPDGLTYECRACRVTRDAAYYSANKSRIALVMKEYSRKNSAKIVARCRAWARANPEKVLAAARARRAKNRVKIRVQYKAWREKNLDVRRAKERIAAITRYRENPQSRLSNTLRGRIYKALRERQVKKADLSFALIGCSLEVLRAHLQSLFTPGMTWENYGPVWHIDHKRPCASFDLTDLEQQRACFNWTNLQPLFAFENCSKGAKIC